MPRNTAGSAISTIDWLIVAIRTPRVVLDSAIHLQCGPGPRPARVTAPATLEFTVMGGYAPQLLGTLQRTCLTSTNHNPGTGARHLRASAVRPPGVHRPLPSTLISGGGRRAPRSPRAAAAGTRAAAA